MLLIFSEGIFLLIIDTLNFMEYINIIVVAVGQAMSKSMKNYLYSCETSLSFWFLTVRGQLVLSSVVIPTLATLTADP